MSQSLVRLRSVAETADDIARAWLEYGKEYAKYPSLWDSSLAFASGPLRPEGSILKDYSGKTGGAAWSVGAGDVPKYVQGSVRGVPFWEGQYDGDDWAKAASTSGVGNGPYTVSAWVSGASVTGAVQVICSQRNASTPYPFLLGIWLTSADAGFYCVAYDGTTSFSAFSRIAPVASGVYHTLLSFDGAFLRLYVNGSLSATSASAAARGDWSNTDAVTLGAREQAASRLYFTGNIAASHIFKRAPTESEIATLSTHPLEAFQTVRRKYISIPWTAPTTTKRALVRKRQAPEVGTDESSTIIRAWKEYGREYAKYPNLWDGSLAFASGPLEPEGGTLRDYSGRTTGAVWSVGAGDSPKYMQGSVKGQAFWAGQYDGSNDYLSLASPVSNYPLSISCWFRSNDATNATVLVALASGTADREDFCRLYLRGNLAGDPVAVQSQDSTGTPTGLAVTTSGFTLGAWHHAAGVFASDSSRRVFIDGGSDAVDTTSVPLSDLTLLNFGRISGLQNSLGLFQYFNGEISSVLIHRRVLTPNEIAVLATHPLAAFETVRNKYWSFNLSNSRKYSRIIWNNF